MELLKFITCGNVDDGKSTLIGHLLYDSKMLFADQEQTLIMESKMKNQDDKLDYSLLLDGLMAEREQGITIDVAYRFFTTPKRSFIVADTPGHEEYTRNMAVGASNADLSVILIDVTKGIMQQTYRHLRVCMLMGIDYYVFAINKMDLVDYNQEAFDDIDRSIKKITCELHISNYVIIPTSATEGDNITKVSNNVPWYKGESLLEHLENVVIEDRTCNQGFIMPVQRVCRPDSAFRGYQGTVESGKIEIGKEIFVLPSKENTRIKSIFVLDKKRDVAYKGEAVTVEVEREIDISRGCILAERVESVNVTNVFTARMLWMDNKTLTEGKSF